MKKIIFASLFALGVLAVSSIQAQTPNATISFVKDVNSLFTITIGDSQGIKEFSLQPAQKSVYGGGLSGCPASFKIDNVSFADPDDFTPVMKVTIVDCKGNIANLEVSPPVKGSAKGSVVSTVSEEPSSTAEPSQQTTTPDKVKEPETLPSSVQYPVPELGNCQNETECKLYCDDSAHIKECVAFAKKHKLLPQEKLEKAEKFASVGKGPGGCMGHKSCETYCNNIDHIDECVAFAKENGYLSGKELAEAEKIRSFIKGGGTMPGGCKDRNTCEVYCSSPDHMEECIAFGERSGMISDEELRMARKMLPLMKSGQTPGGCRSREQCENYCSDENHLDECIAFAEKADILSDEEKEIIRKTGGKGPGGCRGKAQCEAYCNQPANQELCFNWAKENGLMKEEDLQRMREGMRQFQQSVQQMPPEMLECMKQAAGEENFNKMLNGEPVFDRGLEGKMQSCAQKFEEEIRKRFEGQGGGHEGPGGAFPEGFSGPGGCKTPEECHQYCRQNPKECSSFGPPQGQHDGGFPGQGATGGEFPGGGATGGQFPGGPGGCTSPEECQAFCQTNPQACEGFGPNPSGAGHLNPEAERQSDHPQNGDQQFQQQYQQQLPPANFPTSPEQFQQQYPQEYEQIHQEQQQLQNEIQSNRYPTLGEFLLGLLITLLP